MGEARDTIELSSAKVTFVPVAGGAGYSLSEWDIQPGWPSPPVHLHHQVDEGFYILAGHFGFVLDGVTTHAKAGAHVLVPKGHPHSFWNAGSGPARCLLIVSPPGLEDYFRRLAADLGDAGSEQAATAIRKKLSGQFDMVVVGPPPNTGTSEPRS